MKRIRRLVVAGLAGSLVAVAAPIALAQSEADLRANIAKLKPKDFPGGQPIEFTVVYPAGGGMDVNARMLGKYFEKYTGEKVVVNNRVGGAGMIGHTYLATQAKPDGLTVAVIANLIFADSFLRAQGRWSWTDLEPLALLNADGLYPIVANDGPYKGRTFRQIVDTAREKPNTVRVAIVPSSFFEYMVEQIEGSTGARFLKVPFQGGGPGIQAMLGGNVDVALAFMSELRPLLEGGKATPVAISSADRSPFTPDVPTVNESLGTKDIVWMATRWAAVPKGTPADRKAYLTAALQAAVRDGELQAEYRRMGAVHDSRVATPAQLQELLNRLANGEREFFTRTGRLKP